MKVILLMVSSINGKITKGDAPDVYKWSSAEDSELFSKAVEKHNVIVMGRKTYEAGKPRRILKPGKLRVVLTRNPRAFEPEVREGMLEFTNESPRDVVKRFEKLGYKEMLLVGGSEVNAMFLRDKLVDEIHLTIEPVLFGKGKNLIGEENLASKLKLISLQRLNSRGTLHLIYKVD